MRYKPIWLHSIVPAHVLRAIDSSKQEKILAPDRTFGDPRTEEIRFEVPKFQRGFRWGQTKRDEFAESLLEGRPIGTLTFARTEDDDAEETSFLILDGQQRIAAMSLIIEGFWSHGTKEKSGYWKLDNSEETDALKSLAEALDTESEIILEAIRDVVEDTKHLDLADSQFLNKISFTKDLTLPHPDSSKYETAEKATKLLRDSMRNQFNQLNNFEIPIQVIDPRGTSQASAARDLTAKIFVDLNSGVQLSKNELLAAAWESIPVKWKPELPPHVTDEKGKPKAKKQWDARNEVLLEVMEQRIEASYKGLEEQGYEYTVNIEPLTAENISLYDWLYALSATSSRAESFIEEGRTRAAFKGTQGLEELAFDTLSLLLTHNNTPDQKRMKAPLTSSFHDAGKGKMVGNFQNAYFEACQAIDESLVAIRKYVNLSKRQEALGKVSASTYLSYYIKLRYSKIFGPVLPDSKELKADEFTTTQKLERFAKFLPSWWLLDELESTFVGSLANTNATNRVWLYNEETKDHTFNEVMIYPPDLERLGRAFVQLFLAHSDQPHESPKRAPIKKSRKQFLSMLCFLGHDFEEKVEMDHIVAFRKEGGAFPDDSEPLPLNHPANMAPIDSAINKKRSNTPWAEHIKDLSPKENKIIRQRLLVPAEEFTGKVRLDYHLFIQLLLKRWMLMVANIFDNIEHPKWVEADPSEKVIWLEDYLISPITRELTTKPKIEVSRALEEAELI